VERVTGCSVQRLRLLWLAPPLPAFAALGSLPKSSFCPASNKAKSAGLGRRKPNGRSRSHGVRLFSVMSFLTFYSHFLLLLTIASACLCICSLAACTSSRPRLAHWHPLRLSASQVRCTVHVHAFYRVRIRATVAIAARACSHQAIAVASIEETSSFFNRLRHHIPLNAPLTTQVPSCSTGIRTATVSPVDLHRTKSNSRHRFRRAVGAVGTILLPGPVRQEISGHHLPSCLVGIPITFRYRYPSPAL